MGLEHGSTHAAGTLNDLRGQRNQEDNLRLYLSDPGRLAQIVSTASPSRRVDHDRPKTLKPLAEGRLIICK